MIQNSATNLLIKGAKLFRREEGRCRTGDLLIQGQQIRAIDQQAQNFCNSETVILDLPEFEIYPAFIDMQVHLREPGQEYKEDLLSGTQAAARGGYSQVACMPNTQPRLDAIPWIKMIQQKVAARETYAEIFPIAAMTKNLAGKEVCDYNSFKNNHIFAVTDDGRGVQDDLIMQKVAKEASLEKLILMQHAEYENLSQGESFHRGIFTQKNNMLGYPEEAEVEMIARDLDLVAKFMSPYHLLHLTTAKGLDLIIQAKKARLPVTCEVTPHHLLLCDEDIQEPWTQYKMNPPLRTKHDCESLQRGLALGHIDIISTDHAPHSVAEKQQPWQKAPFGIIGLETAFALLYTHLYLSQKIALSRLIDAFCFKAQAIFPVGRRDLYHEARADFTIVAPSIKRAVTEAEIKSKSRNTPFWNWELWGWPVLTCYQGEITYLDERVEQVQVAKKFLKR